MRRRWTRRRTTLTAPGAGVPPPFFTPVFLTLTLVALLVSACGSAAKATQTPLPSATPTPAAVAANKGGFPDSPPIPATAATCAATSEFHSAGAATNGGLGYADIPYPDKSVAYLATTNVTLYGFAKIRVCTNAASADDVLRFFLSSLPANAWKPSETYPYQSDAASACGDPYCWRKAALSDVRYVSIESMSASASVTAYSLRFASAPQPKASLVIRSSVPRTTYTPSTTLSVSASCYAGEQMVSGGYYITSADFIRAAQNYSPYANYPSGPATWTTVSRSVGSAPYTLSTYVYCLQANYPLATKIITTSVDVAKGGSQTATAVCPAGVVTGGGYSFSAPVGVASASAPVSGMGGWTVVATGSGDALKSTTYALCATRNLAVAPDSTLSFNIFSQNASQQSIACKSGDQWLLSGGYSDNDPSGDGKIAYDLNAAQADYSRWFLQGRNLDAASPHRVTLWGVCVLPAPYF
jgi:hypothetical protein